MKWLLLGVLAIATVACSSRSVTSTSASNGDGSAIAHGSAAAVPSGIISNRTRPDSPAAALVRRLVDNPPYRMSALEAIVGPIGMSFRNDDNENMGYLRRPRDSTSAAEFTPLVPRLLVDYHWDMYHQRPTEPRDVSLESFTLEVRGDLAAAEQILRDKYGAPRTVNDRGTQYAAFHPFYLASHARSDRFTLVWYGAVPRFAIPEPDATTRAAWLRALSQRIATANTVDEIDVFCKNAPRDAGIEIVGTLNSTANPYGRPTKDARDYWLRFVPPVRAKVLAGAFNWGTIIGVTHDVHMSSWHAARRADTWLPISGAQAQWEIDAGFTRSPSGGSVARGTSKFGGNAVTDEDEIGSLAIRPRFK